VDNKRSGNSADSTINNRQTAIFNAIVTEYSKLKTNADLIANFKPSFSKRNLQAPPPRPETQIDLIVNLTDHLQKLFQLLTASQSQQYGHKLRPSTEFNQQNNDFLIEVIVFIGSLITNSSRPELVNPINYRVDDQFKLYLRYAQMITNLAEKTVN